MADFTEHGVVIWGGIKIQNLIQKLKTTRSFKETLMCQKDYSPLQLDFAWRAFIRLKAEKGNIPSRGKRPASREKKKESISGTSFCDHCVPRTRLSTWHLQKMPTEMNHALRSILVLSPICIHIFQVVTFLHAFPHKQYIFIFPIRATYPLHYILFFIPQRISIDKYKSQITKLLITRFSPSSHHLPLLGPSIFFSTLFSNTPLLHNVGNQVSHHT